MCELAPLEFSDDPSISALEDGGRDRAGSQCWNHRRLKQGKNSARSSPDRVFLKRGWAYLAPGCWSPFGGNKLWGETGLIAIHMTTVRGAEIPGVIRPIGACPSGGDRTSCRTVSLTG